MVRVRGEAMVRVRGEAMVRVRGWESGGGDRGAACAVGPLGPSAAQFCRDHAWARGARVRLREAGGPAVCGAHVHIPVPVHVAAHAHVHVPVHVPAPVPAPVPVPVPAPAPAPAPVHANTRACQHTRACPHACMPTRTIAEDKGARPRIILLPVDHGDVVCDLRAFDL